MRPLSLLTAAAVLAAACSAPVSASAQDRYSRGVVYRPAAPSVYTAAAPQGSPQGQTLRAAYTGRMLSWPGKVGGPQPRPAQAAVPAPQPPQAPPAPRAMAPARDRYASANSTPDTASRPYANPMRAQAPSPAPQLHRAPVMEQPIRQAAAPAPERMVPPPARRAPLPQSIYDAPQQPQPAPAPIAARQPAPQPAPVQQAFVTPDPDFQGPYPPATKEPWRRLLGDTPPAQGQGVAVPLPAQDAAPAAAAPKTPAKPAKPAKAAKAETGPPPQRLAAAPGAYHNGRATSATRFYSVHRQFGVEPDPIKMPQQFFLDGSPDLSEPPPPPVRRIAPTPGKSTAAIRAAQARSQESPDAG